MPPVRLLNYSNGRRLAFSIDVFPDLTTQWYSDLDGNTTLASILDSLRSAAADIKARRRYMATPGIARSLGPWEIVGDTVMISNRFRISHAPGGHTLNLPIERILGILNDLTQMVAWLDEAPNDAIEYLTPNGGGFTESAVPPMTIFPMEESKDDAGDCGAVCEDEGDAGYDSDTEGDAESGTESGTDESEVKAESDAAVVRMPEGVLMDTLAAVKFTKPDTEGSATWSVVWDNYRDDWSLTFVATTMQGEIVRFAVREADRHSLNAWRAVIDSDGKIYYRGLHHSVSVGARGGRLKFKSAGMGVNRRISARLADVAPVLEQALAFGASSFILADSPR
jgi:hypothetical protein